MHTRTPRMVLTLLIASAVLVACDDTGPDDDEFVATLNGSNEVPENNSTATGTFTLEDEGSHLEFTLTVQGIVSPTAAHIHAGGPGVNGGILVPLFSTGNPPATFSGTLATGDIDATDIVALPQAAAAISLDSLRVLLRTNGAYVNVHTLEHGGGEIRGQIRRD